MLVQGFDLNEAKLNLLATTPRTSAKSSGAIESPLSIVEQLRPWEGLLQSASNLALDTFNSDISSRQN